ncbi:MAG: hypothetical protein ABFS22_05525 [Pseudomonadota bacterium]
MKQSRLPFNFLQSLRGGLTMKKMRSPARLLALLGAGFLSLWSVSSYGVAITETTDFGDVFSPSVFALDLGLNTVSGAVTTSSSNGNEDGDFLRFTLPGGTEIISQTVIAASFPTLADPVFGVNQCQFVGGAGCGFTTDVMPSTVLPVLVTTGGTAPGIPIDGLGILGGSSFSFNCGETTGCGYTVEILIGASVIPTPAAFWLFGSGLLGLIGISRRKKAA